MDLNGTTIHYFFFVLLTTFHKCAERKGIGNTHTFAHRGVRGVLLLSPDNLKWRLLKEVKEAKMTHSSSPQSCCFLLFSDKSCQK